VSYQAAKSDSSPVLSLGQRENLRPLLAVFSPAAGGVQGTQQCTVNTAPQGMSGARKQNAQRSSLGLLLAGCIHAGEPRRVL
jgi:hypothetical protein